MDVYVIDFETHYSKDYSLGKMTTQEYIADSRFEIIGVGIKKNNEPTQWHSFPLQAYYRSYLEPLHGQVVVAHNAAFDVQILEREFGIVPKVIVDTLSMSKPMHGLTVGGSLKALAEKYKIGVKGTEVVDALGKRLADFSEEQLAAYGQYCINDVELTAKLYPMLRKHTTDMEMRVIDCTVRMATHPTLMLDTELLTQALAEEQANKLALIGAAELSDPSELMSNNKFAELLRSKGVEPPMKTSPTTGKETYAFAKSDKGFMALKSDPRVASLVEARLANKSTLNETRMEKLIRLSKLGPLSVPLGYCGAVTTWRWSGQDGLNLQNLPSRGDNTIRRAIKAPEGYKLVVADSSNIELRTNHTLAGQMDVIEMIERGEDLYKDFASQLYGVEIAEVTKDQRFVGKVAHLSLGYGCGWRKFKEMLRISGTDVTDEEAENIVNLWRNTYSQVVKGWRDADKLIKAMLDGSTCEMGGGLVRSRKNMLMTAPKHYIYYPKLERCEDGFQYQSRKGRGTETVKLYGGKVVENLCQHLSRNILAEQLVTIAKKYHVAMMVHDEFVCVVPEDEAETALEWILKVMSTSPSWWPEIPLAAEGDIADRYGDAK